MCITQCFSYSVAYTYLGIIWRGRLKEAIDFPILPSKYYDIFINIVNHFNDLEINITWSYFFHFVLYKHSLFINMQAIVILRILQYSMFFVFITTEAYKVCCILLLVCSLVLSSGISNQNNLRRICYNNCSKIRFTYWH